jgi:hypothetical protein
MRELLCAGPHMAVQAQSCLHRDKLAGRCCGRPNGSAAGWKFARSTHEGGQPLYI